MRYLLALLTIPLFAGPILCNGQFDFSVDVLAWQATHCPVKFGELSFDGPPPKRCDLTIHGTYQAGFRVTGGYKYCDTTASVSYLYFNSNNSKRVGLGQGTTLIMIGDPSDTPLSVAKSRLRTNYQTAEFRAGYDCFSCFYFYGLARYAHIGLEVHNIGTPVDQSDPIYFNLKAKIDAGGVGAGIGGYAPLCCGLGLNTELGIAALIGSRRLPQFDHNTTRVEASGQTSVLPAIDFKLALDYDWCCSFLHLNVAIGYNLHYYHDPLNLAVAPDADLMCTNLGFGGPYAHFGVTY